MKLPFSFKFNKKKPEHFLVLVLRDEKVDAVIFKEQAGVAQVIGQHEEYLQNSIDSISLEEFLDVLDRTISKAQSTLPDSSEPQKTIFGVKEDWVENEKIKKDHLQKLKKACDELGLTPIGFLIISQAISYLLQKEEGAPLSAILIDSGKTSVAVSLIRAGKIVEARSKNIEDKTSITVDDLLKNFSPQESLPSRIIIFDGEKDLNYEFISHQWSKSLPFLHLPQITNLKSDFPARAVLFGVATQMRFEVLGDVGKPDLPKESKDSTENPPQESENLSMEHFGFVKDKDIAQEESKPPLFASVSQPPTSEVPETSEDEPSTQADFQIKSAAGRGRLIMLKTVLNSAKTALSGAYQLLPSFSFPVGRKKTLIIPVLAIILLAGVVIFYLFGTRTTVLLDIKPQFIKQDNNITFSASDSTKKTANIINSKSISISLEGEVLTPTTGKKEVGTKAKGSVTIFNNTDSSKSFPKGAIITSSNDLSFLLDDAVMVSSASGDVFSGTTPGKAKAEVVAEKIGQEFNLPSNTKFSIGDNPSIAAKNDDPFEDGTKKVIAVVSQDDIDKLLEELPKKLSKKAEEELPKKIKEDETLLPVVLSTSITKKDFSKNVDDETDHLTLKGTVEFIALAYKKKDLLSQSTSSLKRNVSNDQTLDEDKIKLDVKDVKKKNEKEIEAILSLEAILMPKIDKEKLINAITGISYKEAQEKLMAIPQAVKVNISRSLDIPFMPKILPKISKNIEIIVNAK